MPDGTVENLVMTASAEPGSGDVFQIGASRGATTANLRTKLMERLETFAQTKLTAASAVQASKEFFDLDAGRKPQRVAGHLTNGEPARSQALATATGLVDATATDTLFWYRGEMDGGSARETATARVDQSITVAHGARANEAGMREMLQSMGAFVAMEFDASDANARGRHAALVDRTAAGLAPGQGKPRVDSIILDLTTAKVSMNATSERHTMSKGSLLSMLDEIKGVDTNEVAASILSLQTRLQASYQTTAILSRLSLVEYI
jgi:flagellar hook-associated protein 3 FlgL